MTFLGPIELLSRNLKEMERFLAGVKWPRQPLLDFLTITRRRAAKH